MKKFEELTPNEVNDIIAIKVMGYTKNPNADGRISAYIDRTIEGGKPYYLPFMPMISLDDCWKAEEVIATMGKVPESRYTFADKYEAQLCGILDYMEPSTFQVIHATAAQKCEAMLRAIGEIE